MKARTNTCALLRSFVAANESAAAERSHTSKLKINPPHRTRKQHHTQSRSDSSNDYDPDEAARILYTTGYHTLRVANTLQVDLGHVHVYVASQPHQPHRRRSSCHKRHNTTDNRAALATLRVVCIGMNKSVSIHRVIGYCS